MFKNIFCITIFFRFKKSKRIFIKYNQKTLNKTFSKLQKVIEIWQPPVSLIGGIIPTMKPIIGEKKPVVE